VRRALLATLGALVCCGGNAVPPPAQPETPPPTDTSPDAGSLVPDASVAHDGGLGRLPPELIQRIVRQNFYRFKGCYMAGLKHDPHLQGRVLTRFIINVDGSVTESEATEATTLPNLSTVQCVYRGFIGLRFPPPEGGGIVTVVYPIQFNPGDGPPPDAGASEDAR
jgi:hypothetical protein